VAAQAHPLTTPSNAHELNPFFTGNVSLPYTEERFLISPPVGLSETVFGVNNYNLAHNTKQFLFIHIKPGPRSISDSPHMFQPVTHIVLPNYKGPQISVKLSRLSPKKRQPTPSKGPNTALLPSLSSKKPSLLIRSSH